jgi:hypothetical protein
MPLRYRPAPAGICWCRSRLWLSLHLRGRSRGAAAFNTAWLSASLIAASLLAWFKLIALDAPLARAEPKTLRYRVLHAAARLARGGRRRQLKIAATWPWADAIIQAWTRIAALAHAP